jgi:hypothetical protein
MIIMHGLFDLKDGEQEEEFRQSFDQFSEYLIDLRMVVSGRFMRHQEHDGYNARAPLTQYYVSVEFADMHQAEECWALIEAAAEPLKSLHNAVFSTIENTVFFLSTDV